MRLLLPYATTRSGHDRRDTARYRSWPGALPVDVTGDPFAYAGLLARHWSSDGWLAIIEHDVVPSPGQLVELLECPMPACTLPYPLLHGEPSLWQVHGTERRGYLWPQVSEWADGSALGCVRWSEEARRQVGPLDPRVPWDWLAEDISERMIRASLQWHVHAGRAVHHHLPAGTPDHPVRPRS